MLSSFFGTTLRRGFDNGVGVQGDRSLCQGSAVQCSAGIQDNRRLTQYISSENGRRAKRRLAGNLPENIPGLGTAAQINMDTVAHGEGLPYLEDPDIVGAARESDISRDQNSGAPFVETGCECHPADSTGAQLGSRGQCPAGGIGVGGFHVAYGRGHGGRSRNGVAGCVYVSGNQGRC